MTELDIRIAAVVPDEDGHKVLLHKRKDFRIWAMLDGVLEDDEPRSRPLSGLDNLPGKNLGPN